MSHAGYRGGVSSWRVRSAERSAARAKRVAAEARRQHGKALQKEAQALDARVAAVRRKRSQLATEQARLDRAEAGGRRRGSVALPSPWKQRQIKRRLQSELRQTERELRSAAEKKRSVVLRLRNRRY